MALVRRREELPRTIECHGPVACLGEASDPTAVQVLDWELFARRVEGFGIRTLLVDDLGTALRLGRTLHLALRSVQGAELAQEFGLLLDVAQRCRQLERFSILLLRCCQV